MKLKHPNIIRYRDHFVDEQMLCILFEFCERGDLETYLNNIKQFNGTLSEAKIKKFVLELLLALAYLHKQDIVHRDVKPSNIYLKGKDYQIQLGDFGSAAQRDTSKLMIVEDVGTLLFQAPEMLQGLDYDGRVDVWSLGCVIYTLCTNLEYPFKATSEKQLIDKICNQPHLPLDEKIPQDIRDLYTICMNKNGQTRPTSAQLLSLPFV